MTQTHKQTKSGEHGDGHGGDRGDGPPDHPGHTLHQETTTNKHNKLIANATNKQTTTTTQ